MNGLRLLSIPATVILGLFLAFVIVGPFSVRAASTPGTYVSLREYVDVRFAAMQRSIDVAKAEADRRLDTMNEFRESLRDQARMFVTRSEFDLAKDRLDEDVRSLRESRASLEGKASANSVMLAYGLSGASLILALVAFLRGNAEKRQPTIGGGG